MANKIPCEIIQDLLPSYMDGLTNEVTNDAVEAHVENCEGCRNALYAMKTPIESETELEEKQKEQREEKQEIDFLKKTRKRNRWVVCCGVVVAFLVMFGFVFYNSYLRPHDVNPELISCHVTVNGSEYTMSGRMLKEGEQLKVESIENINGVITIDLQSKRYLLGDKASEYDAFHLSQQTDDSIKQIKVKDRIVWDNGIEISALTSQVYQTKHDYVGDMPADNESANALLIFQNFDYINELQTTQEPYGWTFVLAEAPVASGAELEEKMEGYAYALLAVVGNLGVVTFEMEDGTVITSVNADDATTAMGQDIKSYGESPANLQVLMEHVGLVSERYADEISDITISYTE